jgi:hypothetical protein
MQISKCRVLSGILHTSPGRSQWPRRLWHRSAAARLLRLWVRIPLGAWLYVCCERCVLSGRGPCDEVITRLEESYWLWWVVVCDLETSWMRRPWPTGGLSPPKQTNITSLKSEWCSLIPQHTIVGAHKFEHISLWKRHAETLVGICWYSYWCYLPIVRRTFFGWIGGVVGGRFWSFNCASYKGWILFYRYELNCINLQNFNVHLQYEI